MITYTLEFQTNALPPNVEFALSQDGTLQNLGTPTATPIWEFLPDNSDIVGGATYRAYYRFLNEDWKETQYVETTIPPDPADTDLIGSGLGLTDVQEETGPTEIAAFVPEVIDGSTVRRVVWISISDLSTLLGNTGGGGGGGTGYTHTQTQASRYWVVTHNLGYRPGGVRITDSGGNTIFPIVMPNDTINQCTLDVGAATTGIAYLS